jgi:hypothetical protein
MKTLACRTMPHAQEGLSAQVQGRKLWVLLVPHRFLGNFFIVEKLARIWHLLIKSSVTYYQ